MGVSDVKPRPQLINVHAYCECKHVWKASVLASLLLSRRVSVLWIVEMAASVAQFQQIVFVCASLCLVPA